jgi:hypothetical protein
MCYSNATVTSLKQNFAVKLRALCAVLALLLGATLAPVTLAVQTDETVCAMACCIAEKHCCCKPAKLSVKGQKHDDNGKQFANTEVSKPCSEGCANTPSSSNLFQRAFVRPATTQFDLTTTAAIHAPPVFILHQTIDFASVSPRAPPVYFAKFSA